MLKPEPQKDIPMPTTHDDNTCKHCGTYIPYFKSDVCCRPYCIEKVKREAEFVRRYKNSDLRTALIAAIRMGIPNKKLPELLNVNPEIIHSEQDIIRQNAR